MNPYYERIHNRRIGITFAADLVALAVVIIIATNT
jgi:hypothetical protein